MAKILLSIKPEYSKKIFNHTKKYEFRKRIPQQHVEKVVVYSSNPAQSVVGEFEVLKILKMEPSLLWDTTKESAGITKEKYQEYYTGCDIAYAYEIGNTELYDTPKKLKDYGITNAPQSFVYIESFCD